MALKKVFKSSMPSLSYYFANGKQAAFINFEFMTDIESEIAELEGLIKSGHPHIYIDANKKEVDTEALDPIEIIKKKAIEEFLAAQASANKTSNDRGNTTVGKLEGISTSATVAELSGESDSIAADAGATGAVAGLKASMAAKK